MSQLESRASEAEPTAATTPVPSVLVIVVAKDGEGWLPDCLLSLSRQTYQRMAVVGVDNGSSDRSLEILESALGADRVLAGGEQRGFAGAVGLAIRTDAAREADYLLLLHDDAILAPDAIANLVDAAQRVGGVGVAGPKILDAMDRRVLRQIGMSTDRFGYPYSPLEAGEIDQGQYDRIREVRYVSSCAMLVAKDAWAKIGPPDERFTHALEDLDFCWRAQLAGFHILMAPAAVAFHRRAGVRGERAGSPRPARARYYRERGALASVLKNYGILSLVWVLPLYLLQGLVRLSLLVLSRRFEDASQILAAWGWNLLHLPGTFSRRLRAQASRSVPDRSIRRSMAPTTIRLRQWAGSATAALVRRREPVDEDEPPKATRVRLARLAIAHPVATAWVATALLLLVAERNVLFVHRIAGGGLGAVPASPVAYFREFLSGVRTTGLGGGGTASPALAALGLGSVVTFANPALFQKALLVVLPLLAAAGCYRVARGMTGDRVAAVVAGGAYGLSGVTLWAFSQGRLGALVLVAGLPWLVTKISVAFDPEPPVGSLRWIVGAGLGLAAIGSFFAGTILAALLLAACSALTASGIAARVRGAWWTGSALIVAAVLALPVSIGLVAAGREALSGAAAARPLSSILRLSLGAAPGGWVTGFALPIAGVVSWVFVDRRFARRATGAAAVALLGLYLAWASAAGYLPRIVSNPAAYAAVAAIELSLLVGFGLASVLQGVRQASFGRRQVGTVLLAAAMAVDLGGQAVQAARGGWMIGQGERAPAFVAVDQPSSAPYRVLWLGRDDGEPFPSPGGLPDGAVAAGRASVRFAVTLSTGASALDEGRASAGPGYGALRRAVGEILAGTTRHGGALLGPLGIRFVVAGTGDITGASLRQLSRQLDLSLLLDQGLMVWSVANAAPRVSVIGNVEWRQAARSGDLLSMASLPVPAATLLEGGGERYTGTLPSTPSLVLLGEQDAGGWTLTTPGGPAMHPIRAFGWAVGFLPRAGPATFVVHFDGQRGKTVQIAFLAILWFAALWLTRRQTRSA
jgi:GT2 family glycosyltransferase